MADTRIHIPTLETERFRLRAPIAADLPEYAAFCASPRSVHVGGPYNDWQAHERLAAIVGHWQLHGFGRWLVADKVTDEPLGIVGLMHPPDWPEPEIAWSVFDSAEGRGVAHEAAICARAYAYDTLGWTRVISCTSPENTRSIALALRMGAVHESDFDHPEIGTLNVWRHLSPKELAA